jgi:hypothetical protein
MTTRTRASSGHKLGQLVGDWFEEQVAVTLLQTIADELGLYLDHRFRQRKCRAGKIVWSDLDANDVDYDFVLELGGTDSKKGVPLAFFETFWRRGARHSKDKARDDSGKLMPMRETYPTARVLGIISAGDFTKPAQELVRSRAIDLFYIPKAKICESWQNCDVEMDYSDSASEEVKSKIANEADKKLTNKKKESIYQQLVKSLGKSVFDSYVQRIVAGIAAVPIEYHITPIFIGKKAVFNNYADAERFLKKKHSGTDFKSAMSLYRYGVIFSDGNLFERENLKSCDALDLHEAVGKVAKYFQKYHANKTVDSTH